MVSKVNSLQMALVQVSDLPSGYVEIAIEHGHRNSELPINSMVIFHGYVKLPEGRGTMRYPMFRRGVFVLIVEFQSLLF